MKHKTVQLFIRSARNYDGGHETFPTLVVKNNLLRIISHFLYQHIWLAVAFRSLPEKATAKSDSFKKRNEETFDSEGSRVSAILPVHVCNAKLRWNRRAKSSRKFRTVNIPKLQRATVQDFLRFVLFSSPPAGANSDREEEEETEEGQGDYEIRTRRVVAIASYNSSH